MPTRRSRAEANGSLGAACASLGATQRRPRADVTRRHRAARRGRGTGPRRRLRRRLAQHRLARAARPIAGIDAAEAPDRASRASARRRPTCAVAHRDAARVAAARSTSSPVAATSRDVRAIAVPQRRGEACARKAAREIVATRPRAHACRRIAALSSRRRRAPTGSSRACSTSGAASRWRSGRGDAGERDRRSRVLVAPGSRDAERGCTCPKPVDRASPASPSSSAGGSGVPAVAAPTAAQRHRPAPQRQTYREPRGGERAESEHDDAHERRSHARHTIATSIASQSSSMSSVFQ